MMRVMAAPRKYSVELQQRATRMAMDARKDPESARGAIKRVADQLGVHPEALRNWVRQAEIDGGVRPGTTTDDATRLAELEREARELRRANEILKTSAAFFAAAELDRKIMEMESMRKTLGHLIHCCHGDDRPDCPILGDLESFVAPATTKAKVKPQTLRASAKGTA